MWTRTRASKTHCSSDLTRHQGHTNLTWQFFITNGNRRHRITRSTRWQKCKTFTSRMLQFQTQFSATVHKRCSLCFSRYKLKHPMIICSQIYLTSICISLTCHVFDRFPAQKHVVKQNMPLISCTDVTMNWICLHYLYAACTALLSNGPSGPGPPSSRGPPSD